MRHDGGILLRFSRNSGNSRMNEWNFWRMEQGRKVDSILQMHGSSRKREKKLYESARKKNLFIAMERNINGGEERTFSVETERK